MYVVCMLEKGRKERVRGRGGEKGVEREGGGGRGEMYFLYRVCPLNYTCTPLTSTLACTFD